MRITKWFLLALAAGCLALTVHGEPMATLDLHAFVGPSPVDNIGTPWLLAHGRQVLDGTPFQVDGVILLYATNAVQKSRPARTNVNDIPVGKAFERLHLLASSQSTSPDGTVMARIHLRYADGSNAVVEVRYGDHVRTWFGPWHKPEAPLGDPNARMAWIIQNSGAATTDDYIRFFHVALTNPVPGKEVRSLSLESNKRAAGLMILGMSVGPAEAERLPDTQPAPKSPYPDLRPRTGEPARGEGIVRSRAGAPIAGARVRVMGVREFNTNYSESRTDDPAVGAETTTDADGRFILPPLPDNRLYRVLAVADGFEPFTHGGADPKSDPIEIRLAPLAAPDATGNPFAHLRVVSPEGMLLAGTLVEPQGVATDAGSSWGGPQGFPENYVTGTNGEVVLTRKEPFTRIQVRICAPGFAPAHIWLEATTTVQTVAVSAGSTLRGRVLKEGQPLAGVRVGVSGSNRSLEVYAGQYEARTGSDGVFAFEHLPPNIAWSFYGMTDSLKSYGALPPRIAQSAGEGETNDLGDLTVVPGLRLAGKIQTRHGEPLPENLKVRLSFNNSWDSRIAGVDAEGRFAFEGLFQGQISVSMEVARLAVEQRQPQRGCVE